MTDYRISALAINDSGYIFAGTADGVFLSKDNSDSWEEKSAGLTDKVIWALAIDDSGNVFAGTFSGVFLSTDDGEDWSNPGTFSGRSVALAINQNGHIFSASGQDEVYRSTDGGVNWTESDVGTFFNRVEPLAISNTGYIFAGTEEGIFYSVNNGDQWIALSTGLPNSIVFALTFLDNGHLLAGTECDGVFRNMNPPTSVREIESTIPQDFTLEQNYPNPFNPTTVISFQLPVSSHVRLRIYNLKGQLARTLVDEQKSVGRHQVVWDGLNVSVR